MVLRRSSFALVLGLSLAGCISTAGPFVRTISHDGHGSLVIERCDVEFTTAFSGQVSTGACSQETVALPAEDPRAHARATALALTKVAASAARRGDCVTVGEIDPQVRGLDVRFRDTVFARDVAIARCLAPAAS